MKHIKTFEELNPGTYFSAADKLDKKGHSKRSDNLYDHGKSKMKTPFNFTIWFSPKSPSPSRFNSRGWVATREEANHIFQICKEMGIKDVKVNDLYKEGVDKDPKMQSFTAEFQPKFKKFVNIDENSVSAQFAFIGPGGTNSYAYQPVLLCFVPNLGQRPGVMSDSFGNPRPWEQENDQQTTAPADAKTEIKNKGFIQKVGDFFGKGNGGLAPRIH